MGLRTPNLAGEDRRPTLEEREPKAAVHLLVKHIKGGGSRRPDPALWVGVDNALYHRHRTELGSCLQRTELGDCIDDVESLNCAWSLSERAESASSIG